MADHELQTNPPSKGIVFKLRSDTYERWMSSDVLLKAGEAAVAIFPDNSQYKPPLAVGIKIGTGRHYFDELPWIQALAADVYEWAKSSTKPTYSATEISGLAEYIQQHSSGGSGGSTSSGAYQIIWDANTSKYILQQWNEQTSTWDNTASEINLSTILNRIDTIERWANGAKTRLGNIEIPLAEYIYEEVIKYINQLNYTDSSVEHEFVTSVSESHGIIEVTRAPLTANDITSGVLSTAYGGTGLNAVDEDEVLIGSINGNITTKKFVTEIDNVRNAFATVGAIKDYINEKTEGLTGAMHFVGEATITITPGSHTDPQITGYNFRNVQPGDVILANNAQEYVWTGDSWRLLGDEGSYAVKGSIVNADIAEEANISQSKIDGLEETFNTKVDKVEGKQLSTNDYSNEDQTKLASIENDAQVNIIEHFFLNDEEINPSTVGGLPKSIDMHFNGMSREQSEKLDGIEEGAQVNAIEHIQLNGTEVPIDNTQTVNIEIIEYTNEEKEKLATVQAGAEPNAIKKIVMDNIEEAPDSEGTVTLQSNPEHINKIEHIFVNGIELTPATINSEQKAINITIDESALTFQILKGARYPINTTTYADIEIDTASKKLELSHLAATGNVQHLQQTQDTYIILNCGSSTDVV